MRALFKLFGYLRNYRGAVIVSLAFSLIAAAMNLIQPEIIQRAVDVGVGEGRWQTVLLSSLALFGSAIVAGGLHLSAGVLLVRAGQGMSFDIRNDLFARIMSFSFGNLDRWRTGELLVRTNSDVNTIRMFIRLGLLLMIQSILTLVVSLIFMYNKNPELSRVMFILLPGTFVIFLGLATLLRPMVMKVRERLDGVNNTIQENLAGAKVVRAFAQQEFEEAKFNDRNESFLKLSLKVGYLFGLAFPLIFFLGQMALVLPTWFGGVEVIEGIYNPSAFGLTLGELLAFQGYALRAVWPILALGFTLQMLTMAIASASRINELLADTPTIEEANEPTEIPRLSGEIEFRGVDFSYGDGDNSVCGISFTVRPGEKLGILGRTGAGKSTLASLIPRFYDPTRGSVRIDGQDVRELTLETLRERITLVLQETVLLSGTILENVGYANHTKLEQPDDVIREAADLACATEFIEAKEHGWDEHVGERGAGLSGGQRQRAAIARAIVSDPDILILDDVTSALDAQTERTIVGNLYERLQEKTVIIISQKINTVMMADRIIIMDEGEIVAEGTHDELLASNAMYREIHETQSAEIRA
jgi:ATP-binding cassette subfamily B multidrug efflux pump